MILAENQSQLLDIFPSTSLSENSLLPQVVLRYCACAPETVACLVVCDLAVVRVDQRVDGVILERVEGVGNSRTAV